MNQTSESQHANPLCTICNKGQLRNAKVHPCGVCNLGFHSACCGLESILKDEGGTHKVCSWCIAKNNPSCSGLQLTVPSPHGSAASSLGSTPENRSRSNSHSSQNSTTKSDPGKEKSMELILKKLKKLDQVKESLANISQKLEPLKLIPQILERVEATEKDVADLKQSQAELRSDVDELTASAATGNPPSNDRIEQLEQQNTQLTNQIKVLMDTRKDSPDELVIGGVKCDAISTADLKKLSLAILKVVNSALIEHDILEARLLPVRSNLQSEGASNGAIAAAEGGNSTSSASRSIVVSMHSASLVKAIVSAKAKFGKLHSSRVDSALLREAGVDALSASHININEMLPPDVYKLRRAVFQKAKDQKFKFFIRQGQLFARKRRRDVSVLITTMEDLNTFLG